jgi:cysteinyl-tRNA synthetase
MEAVPLQVYNTLSKKKEPFTTVAPGKVGMYVCGPTVYKPSHLGHMVGPVIFDTVKRYLQYLGYEVTFVVNITDVDDKLIVEARKQNTTVTELAERVTKDYVKNLELLNVTGIDHMPRATHHIAAIIDMIKGLVAKGHAYPAGGDVYFDVTKDEDYGKLCHRDPEQLEAGARIEVSDKKHNPGDFALWKNAKPGEPSWDSPWGKGRPGWHIECSAMSMQLLGKTLDIHGGGLDLQFPHHENELAQSESYTGVPFVRYWMHNGLMKIGGEKVSKTHEEEQKKKATLVVSEVFQKHDPETVRFLLLATHYRRPIDYGEDRLQETRRGVEGFYRFFERFQRITKTSFYDLKAPTRRRPVPASDSSDAFTGEVIDLWKRFLEHMDDDFNTGGAIGILYEMLSALNRFADARQLEGTAPSRSDVEAFQRAAPIMKELTQILGIFQKAAPAKEVGPDKLVAGLMQLLIDLRAEARKAKNFALGDQIRKRLTDLGVTLEDRAAGTSWRAE